MNHHPAGSTTPGGPWVGSFDVSTGKAAAIAGVTDFFGRSCQITHGNFVPTSKGRSLAFASLNMSSGWYAMAVTLPASSGQQGTVQQLAKVTDDIWPPAWTEADGADGAVGWTAEASHSTGSGALVVQETLQTFALANGSATSTLGTTRASYPDGNAGPAHYGYGHAVDPASRVLYTQSANQSVRVLDMRRNRTLPSLAGTAGTELMCLHYDAASGRLGAIVNRTAATGRTELVLVGVDTTSGAMSTRASWDASVFPGRLEPVHYSSSAERSPPMCSFDQVSGALAMLLYEQDAAALPGWDHQALFVATLNVRSPGAAGPSAPARVAMPFRSDQPLGNRTWRALEVGMSFV